VRPLPDASPLRAAKAAAVETLAPLLNAIVPQEGRIATPGDYYEWYFAYGEVLRPKTVLEIGVLGGGSAASLVLGAGGENCSIEHFDLIDNESHDQQAVPLALAASRVTRAAGGKFRANAYLLDSQRLRALPDGPLYDLISIDGDHRTGPCFHDLRISLPRLAPGGHILCDDAQWDWVKWAVDDFVAEHAWLDDLFVATHTGTRVLHSMGHIGECPLLEGCR